MGTLSATGNYKEVRPGPCARRRFSGQSGSSLVVVVLTVFAAALYAELAQSSSFHSSSSTTTSHKQVNATAAANAGIDLAIQSIGSAPSSQLPCGNGVLTGTLGTVPVTSSYSASIAYYSALPPNGMTLSCNDVQTGLSVPAAALISSVGTSASPSETGPQQMEMQALLQLVAVPGGGFNDAIFANGSIGFSNLTTINGQPGQGSNADLYSNQSYSCSNNEVVHGSITVFGGFSATNRCSVDGTVYSTGDISFNNSGTVGGDLKSSQGNVSVLGTNVVNGSIIAHGSVSLSSDASILGNIVQDAVISDPPHQDFPSFTFSGSEWDAAGYTRQITDNDCNRSDPVNVYGDISAMSTVSTPTVIQTTCALSWSNNSSVILNSSLAVISTGGFSAVNRLVMSATGSNTVNLFLIVPSTVSCSGSQGAIDFGNNSNFDPPIDVFLYSPCDITFSNNQATFGQIYSGSNVTIDNLYTMTYVPMAMPSLSGFGNSTALETSIIYERQVAPGS